MRKKGSLNMAIEVIVVIVIALTVLGLGLTFVKQILGDTTDTATKVQDQIKEQILEDMRTSGKKLSVSREVRLERGDETAENIGIVNTGTTTQKYGIYLEPIKKQVPGEPEITDVALFEDELSFFYNGEVDKILSPTDGDVIPVSISADRSASGNYLCKVTVYSLSQDADPCTAGEADCGSVYDSMTFFVKVS